LKKSLSARSAVQKRPETTPKQRQNTTKTTYSASEPGAEESAKEFFNTLGSSRKFVAHERRVGIYTDAPAPRSFVSVVWLRCPSAPLLVLSAPANPLSAEERGAGPSPQADRPPEPCHPLVAPRAPLRVSRPQPSGAASVLGLVHQCELTLAEHLGGVGVVHRSCLLRSRSWRVG
jgi:hypothetical protein